MFDSRRLQYPSTVHAGIVSMEEANRVFQPSWSQVHVHLGCAQILVAGQLLDWPC